MGRLRIAGALRQFFMARDFVEVETPALVPSPGNETHLHAFATDLVAPAGTRERRYLRTSPEFACKKLLAAGERRIVEFARSFRNRERGALHHPEFTMLEWYRANERYEVLMADCAAILALAAETAGTKRFAFRDRAVDPFAAPERLTVAEAFARSAGIDLMARAAAGAPVAFCRGSTGGGRSHGRRRHLGGHFQPRAGRKDRARSGHGPADDPLRISGGAVAARAPEESDPRLAERFELYACGVELANGFGELTDAAEQRQRLEEQMTEKERIYGERYPIDEDFLAALDVMPDACGIALGFDRLVMLATGAISIEQVMWMPMPET